MNRVCGITVEWKIKGVLEKALITSRKELADVAAYQHPRERTWQTSDTPGEREAELDLGNGMMKTDSCAILPDMESLVIYAPQYPTD